MFWLGLIIALISGLLGINLLRKKLSKYFPNITETHIDKILIACFILGLGIASIQYLIDQSEINSLK